MIGAARLTMGRATVSVEAVAHADFNCGKYRSGYRDHDRSTLSQRARWRACLVRVGRLPRFADGGEEAGSCCCMSLWKRRDRGIPAVGVLRSRQEIGLSVAKVRSSGAVSENEIVGEPCVVC